MPDSVLVPLFMSIRRWDKEGTSLVEAKKEAIEFVKSAPFKKESDRQKVIANIEGKETRKSLELYLGDSILFFMGHRVIN